MSPTKHEWGLLRQSGLMQAIQLDNMETGITRTNENTKRKLIFVDWDSPSTVQGSSSCLAEIGTCKIYRSTTTATNKDVLEINMIDLAAQIQETLRALRKNVSPFGGIRDVFPKALVLYLYSLILLTPILSLCDLNCRLPEQVKRFYWTCLYICQMWSPIHFIRWKHVGKPLT